MQWSETGDGAATLGQFATPDWAARLLCSRLRGQPNSVLDLGYGKGALSIAFWERVGYATTLGVDKYAIPPSVRNNATVLGTELIRRDVSAKSFVTRINMEFGQFDAVISNPPFIRVAKDASLTYQLRESGLDVSRRARFTRLDLIFLDKAKRLLKDCGQMAFIMPNSAFAVGKATQRLPALIYYFGLSEIVLLPSDTFASAEVETAILIFDKIRFVKQEGKVKLLRGGRDERIEDLGTYAVCDLEVALQEAIQPRESNCLSGMPTLNSLGATIARGKHSSNALDRDGVAHFHTSSFAHFPSALLSFDSGFNGRRRISDIPAQEGDILIARVGTRCLGRAAIVVSGQRIVSDCVYRISTPDKKRREIWEFLASEVGRNWQQQLARGACAKFITRDDLLNAPIPRLRNL